MTNQLALAAQKGLESVKIAFGIVLGIVFIVSIPREAFQIKYWRQRRLRKVDVGEAMCYNMFTIQRESWG